MEEILDTGSLILDAAGQGNDLPRRHPAGWPGLPDGSEDTKEEAEEPLHGGPRSVVANPLRFS